MFKIACVAQMRTTLAGGVMALRDPSTGLRMMLWVHVGGFNQSSPVTGELEGELAERSQVIR